MDPNHLLVYLHYMSLCSSTDTPQILIASEYKELCVANVHMVELVREFGIVSAGIVVGSSIGHWMLLGMSHPLLG